jgi:hypothetical protein
MFLRLCFAVAMVVAYVFLRVLLTPYDFTPSLRFGGGIERPFSLCLEFAPLDFAFSHF